MASCRAPTHPPTHINLATGRCYGRKIQGTPGRWGGGGTQRRAVTHVEGGASGAGEELHGVDHPPMHQLESPEVVDDGVTHEVRVLSHERADLALDVSKSQLYPCAKRASRNRPGWKPRTACPTRVRTNKPDGG